MLRLPQLAPKTYSLSNPFGDCQKLEITLKPPIAQGATDNGKGKFRILAVPDEDAERADPRSRWPSKAYLRQGVRVHGWVLLSRVRLGYELWRQFNGFPPVIAKSEPGDEKGKSDGKAQGGK